MNDESYNAALEHAARVLDRRVAGYSARADVIFNGRIMADELAANARFIRGLSRAASLRASERQECKQHDFGDCQAVPMVCLKCGVELVEDFARYLSEADPT